MTSMKKPLTLLTRTKVVAIDKKEKEKEKTQFTKQVVRKDILTNMLMNTKKYIIKLKIIRQIKLL